MKHADMNMALYNSHVLNGIMNNCIPRKQTFDKFRAAMHVMHVKSEGGERASCAKQCKQSGLMFPSLFISKTIRS